MTADEIKTVPSLIHIPDNAVKIKVIATLLNENDEFQTAEMILRLPDITEARIQGEEWENENVAYTLTEEGCRYVEELERRGEI